MSIFVSIKDIIFGFILFINLFYYSVPVANSLADKCLLNSTVCIMRGELIMQVWLAG